MGRCLGPLAVLTRSPRNRLGFLTSELRNLLEHLMKVKILGSLQKLILSGSDPQLPRVMAMGLKSKSGSSLPVLGRV